MATVKINLPEITGNIKTFLSADYTSGTSLTVESSASFANGQYIIIGEPGLEKTEATNLTAAPGVSTLTISALSYSHPKGTPVYYINWDQYALQYRTATTESWTNYASMPTNLRWDAPYTEYRDAAATSTYGWRYRYYSTEKTAYSDYSDTISATGWGDNTVGYMIRNVRKIAGDPDGKTVSDTELIRYFNAAQDKIYTRYDRWWFLFKVGTAINTVASTASYSLPSDFGRMHSVLFRYVFGDTDITYSLKYLSLVEYDYQARDNNAEDNDDIVYYTIMPGDSTNATGYLKIWPKPETAALDITPRYYKTITDLDSYGDATEVPLPSMLEDYALAQIFKIRKEEEKAKYYDTQFREQLDLLKLMQRKQAGPPRYLWRFEGRKAMSRLYGDRSIYSDATREEQW